ncbi:beta-galactosidase [Agaribacterium sp. ZY112]|uniref:beta-galactosidase n=1 Tax=Agaribacterium sp. ZY112 TaxID=3233574 RepID=UPI003525154B
MKNYKLKALSAGVLLCSSLLLGACQETKTDDAAVKQHEVLETLYSFDADTIPSDVKFIYGKGELIEDPSGKSHELRVKLDSKKNAYANVHIQPEKPWDWSQYNDFSLAIDVGNLGDVSAQIYVDITDIDGANYTRTIAVPVGPAETYYGKMRGHDLGTPDGDVNVELNFESGLRSNPPTWNGYDDNIFVSLWGKKNLNTSGIVRIALSVQSALRDKEFTIDNVRLIKNPKQDPKFLVGIVDQYGQNAKNEFPGKIHSDEEMLAQRDSELKALKAGKPKDRGKFNGWTAGPKLKATGYFRTEKVDGKWYLVDPEGYLYFGTGIDIIRLSNSTTMTGYDFDPDKIRQRSADDLTPEDSEGLNRAPDAAIPTRRVVSDMRADMFEWLPDYDEPLGKHFGYRREAHSGPMKHGEVYSFYSANLERKYGANGADYMEEWRKVTVDRMLNWGFAALGNWTDPSYYDNDRIPFFANGWIIGDFKTVSSGNDFWAPMPDVFDPVFEERAYATVRQVAAEVKGTPWCVGVFIDNEKSFGRSETHETRLGIVIHTLGRDGNDVPTKAEFTRLMKEKYGSIDKLNKAWGKNLGSWDDFNKGVDSSFVNKDAQVEDYQVLLHAYATKYFATVNKAMKELMPNHLYLGSRFPDWGMPMPVVKAAAENVDVVSYNSYKEGLPEKKWKFLADLDMPSIIGEFHFGTLESGLYHPGLIHAANNEDRARAYTEYMHSVIDNPYMVGAHWFQYIDSPITGRAYDGENYNVGFVSVADVPYAPMVEAAKKLHNNMYERRYNDKK